VNVSPYRLAATVFALLALSIPLQGDTSAETKSAAKPPLHDELARLVGSWDATVTFRFGGKENQGQARCEAKWILDEHCVQQEYSSIFMGKPLTILQLLSYDSANKKITEIHMTNRDGGALKNEGESLSGGKEWKLSGPFIDPQTRKPTRLRTVYTFQDADHFTLDWFTPEADGKELRGVHITHTRRK
jgi:uncharacterized protein DUF1579